MRNFIFILCAIALRLSGQLNGTITVPGSYPSIADALTDINNQGTASGLTLQIAAGYTEHVTAGGFALQATGSASSPIHIKKYGSGPNPLLIAYTGNKTPGSATQDGMLRLIGCDYVTIESIDFYDPNVANPATMEFGIGLFKASGTDGCQHNTIINCAIRLNRINNASGTGPAADGSRGIELVNATVSTHNSSTNVSAMSGSHSYNTFRGNIIENCNTGISLNGSTGTAPYTFCDRHNQVGDSLGGNTIINFGGGGTQNAAVAIKIVNQYHVAVRNNVINNNTGQGINHGATLRGIQLSGGNGADISVMSNTVTLHGGSVSSVLTAIDNGSGNNGNGNTVLIRSNVVKDCTNPISNNGLFYCIINSASASTVEINNNFLANNSTHAASGSAYMIYNTGAVNALSVSGNTISFAFDTHNGFGGNFYGIYNNSSTVSQIGLENNRIGNVAYRNNTGSGSVYMISNVSDFQRMTVCGNIAAHQLLNQTGPVYFLHNTGSCGESLTVATNTLTKLVRNAATGNLYGYYGSAATPSSAVLTFSANEFSHITCGVSGSGGFTAIHSAEGNSSAMPVKIIHHNLIEHVNLSTTGNAYGMNISNGNTDSEIFSNRVHKFQTAGTACGIYYAGGTSLTSRTSIHTNTISGITGDQNAYGYWISSSRTELFRNRISNISALNSSGTAHGVYVSGTGELHAHNNILSAVEAPSSSGANRANGIYLSSSALVTLDFNTVHLTAGTCTNAGSNALYAFTGASLTLRNNIFMNTATPAGTAIATAYRRSGTSQTNYHASSNNNLYNCGIAGPNNMIFYNGSSYQTIAAFKSYISPKESLSHSQLPMFLSEDAQSPWYYHPTASISGFAESAGQLIPNMRDCDDEPRQGHNGYTGSGTYPDIGADEFEQDTLPCDSVPVPLLNALQYELCDGESAQLFTHNIPRGTGISWDWKISNGTTSYTSLSLSNNPHFTTPLLNAGQYFFLVETGCAASSVTTQSDTLKIEVHSIPSITCTAFPNAACTGQLVQLDCLSLNDVACEWRGPGGFSSTQTSPSFTLPGPGADGVYSVQAFAGPCASPIATAAISVSEVTAQAVTSSSLLCSGESASLTVAGTAQSYTWQTGTHSMAIVSPTANSTFSVAISGTNGCVVTRSVGISVIQPTITGTGKVSCESPAQVTLDATAFPDSQIEWFTSVTSTLVSGSGEQFAVASPSTVTFYAEAVSSILNHCRSARIPITLTVSLPPAIKATIAPVQICAGNSATLTATGATSYSWVGIGSKTVVAVQPSASTIYTLRGWHLYPCANTATVALSVLNQPTIGIAPSTTFACPSTPVTLTATGAITYTWNSGSTATVATVFPAQTTAYQVTGTDENGCAGTWSLTIATKTVPVVKISTDKDQYCEGELVTLTANGAISYTWLPSLAKAATDTVMPATLSVINVIGLSVNGCTNIGYALLQPEHCLHTGEEIAAPVRIFPVPAKRTVSIQPDDWNGVGVYSTHLQKIGEYENTNDGRLDVSSLSPGVYIAEIRYPGRRIRVKLVRE